ncbi:RNA polymerase sigma-70 factor (ECF subfamily) [Scopulibacillus darangshiensis]|uniref:RNA polymerase sigma-70 factor (ECF subfamily) n=1 Tax=Scopulibacillus darangshiensis TaxID=442528 RepID=A0A4R2P5C7_9BACL|nr:RNA polymerase sigma factor [Scopulibacillus darangshiensis]TCP29398.1 RNA polymerase sigma-70 factor (ECF subfamily) [Scopulibacillus darangshiensis]
MMTAEVIETESHSSSFEAFVSYYHKPLLNYLERILHDPAKAEDIIQETFLKFLLQIKYKQTPDNVRAWLFRVATNLCRDYWRSAGYRREKQLLDQLPEQKDRCAQAAEFYERAETRMEMFQLLSELSEAHRKIIILRFYNDMKLQDIAAVMGCPVGTIKSRLFHALRYLKNRMEEEGRRGFG